MHLSPKQPVNTFPDDLALTAYSLGMGALGLPGDFSSTSRFVRVAFTKMNAFSGDSEKKREPVLSHSRFRGSAARMLRSSRWKIRDYTYHTINDQFSFSLHTSTHPFASATRSSSKIVSFTCVPAPRMPLHLPLPHSTNLLRGTLVSLLYNRSLRWSGMQGRHLLFRE